VPGSEPAGLPADPLLARDRAVPALDRLDKAEPLDLADAAREDTAGHLPQRPPRRPRWSRRRKVVVAAIALPLLVVVYFVATLAQVWWVGRQDQSRPADAIVVLGAAQYDGRPSPQLAARLDHALSLWREGYAATIVVTGGNQPGDRFTEASASADYLIERGVPDEQILREVQGKSSWESLAASARFLRERGLDTVILVSDPFHMLRLRGIAEEVGLTAYTSPTRTSPVRGVDAFQQMVKEAGGVGIGRIIGYRRLLRLTG
jgi:uncharacterized SAM-binding protein YcdF (DUF218 family)